MQRLPFASSALFTALLTSVIVAFCQSPVRAFEAFDVFVLLDTSGSMAAKGGTNLVNIFPEVKRRLINDIKSRRTGDHVAIYTFDEGRPRLLAAKTISAQADYGFFETQLSNLDANGAFTFLDLCCYEVFTSASQYARSHTNHLVEIRVYTDGSNNGPPLSASQRQEIKLQLSELPYLMFSYCLYNQPGASNKPPFDVPLHSINTVFVRVDHGSGSFGNLRSEGFKHDFPVVTYFDQDVKGRPVFCEPTIDPLTSKGQTVFAGQLTPNISPRPVEITDKTYHLTFEVANGREVPEEAKVEFTGRISFKAGDVVAKAGEPPPLPIQFLPDFVPITGRIAPQSILDYTVEGVRDANANGSTAHLSLTGRKLIHTDRGLSTMLLRFALVDQIRVRPDQKLVLEAEVPDAQLKEFPVARFLASAAEAGEGRRVLTVDRDTKEFFLRLDYRPRHLVKITQAGYYPVELRVRPADEDLVAEFAFLGTGTGARQRLDMLRFFPGQAPTISNYSGLLATRVLESTTQVLVSRLQPPPAIGWKILITMSEGAALFAVLQFVCFVPWGTSGGLSALFLVVAWFFGGWRGFLVLPQESTDTLVWMSLGLVCILFIHMPWCFARTPWFGGWSVDGRSLRVLARNKRRRAFFLMPGVDKLKIRVGGPRGFDWSDTSFDGQELTLIHPSRTALTPGRQLKLLANNQNVQLGIRPLKPGDVVILDDGARLRVRRRDLEFRAN